MQFIHTYDGKVTATGSSSTSRALDFITRYPWIRIGDINSGYVVVEEVGRNTRRVSGFGYSGSPDEILPLLQYLYYVEALGASCFCAPAPDWKELVVLMAAEALRRFPETVKMPLPVLCSCVRREEFRGLADLLSAKMDVAKVPILLGPGIIPDWNFSVFPGFSKLIAMMLIAGIMDKATMERVIRLVAADYSKNEDNVFAALSLCREGACSFDEAIVLV